MHSRSSVYCVCMYAFTLQLTHFSVGLRSGRDRFLFFLLTMVLVAFAATGQVFAFSAMFRAYNVAYAVLLMIITITVVSVTRHNIIVLNYEALNYHK